MRSATGCFFSFVLAVLLAVLGNVACYEGHKDTGVMLALGAFACAGVGAWIFRECERQADAAQGAALELSRKARKLRRAGFTPEYVLAQRAKQYRQKSNASA